MANPRKSTARNDYDESVSERTTSIHSCIWDQSTILATECTLRASVTALSLPTRLIFLFSNIDAVFLRSERRYDCRLRLILLLHMSPGLKSNVHTSQIGSLRQVGQPPVYVHYYRKDGGQNAYAQLQEFARNVWRISNARTAQTRTSRTFPDETTAPLHTGRHIGAWRLRGLRQPVGARG